jgi:protein-disulfide isomerase
MEEEKKSAERECCGGKDKKVKNLISLVILLGGLLLGSIFVDVIQLAKGGGFSPKKLSQTDIFNFGDKTWVAYKEPIVKVQVISDETCEACNPDNVILALHSMIPTMLTEKVDYSSKAGSDLINKFEIKTLPAFVFFQDIEKTDFFKQSSQVLDKKDDLYALNNAKAGIQPGKYLESMQVKEDDIQVGDREAKVKVFLFSDFQCPYCKVFHESILKKIISAYGDKILLVFKNYPLSMHPQAENAALAGECANEQGKFMAYADKIFANQASWGKTKGTQSFKAYAQQIGLNAAKFGKCLDGKKYADKISAEKNDADSFGISATPALFIDNQSINISLGLDGIKKIIDQNLAK